ncbi:glycerophosphoryl diester phosphodiesterase [Bryocella elongata]|uniref:Glycerophosphoryl diester phosphodiesterase n=1 Tax=Bryocella elongata TaxID=863522 RepID=A0A1H5VY21_9BACT|nr:glycerophosphodiester phosphodiesterase family protein [Bryocella elongata]SEF92154.1 glycerophosphoryl diester phosphodiesterase [Bryocella elongata]
MSLLLLTLFAATFCAPLLVAQGSDTSSSDPYMELMQKASAHAKKHHTKYPPALSPLFSTLLGPDPEVHVADLQKAGFKVVPWTTNDPEQMKQLLALKVDGIISDRPDILHKVILEAREAAKGDAAQLAYLDQLDAEGHRGGRGIRPENTLPAFEGGLDNGIHTIETDTGVTTDHQSLIWHDQFLNPQSCRHADGTPYTLENRVYTRDISMADAQKTFICDKLHFGPDQKNDLALSPVAVAFAKHEGMISPYAPTSAAQLFRFVNFYEKYYESGEGSHLPEAKQRAYTAKHVHFNLETKIVPPGISEASMMAQMTGHTLAELKASGKVPASAFEENHTVDLVTFVDTLCGFIREYHMQERADVQSFDFRTLLLVQEKYPEIPTYYLTESAKLLSSEMVPEELRVSKR